MSDLYSHESIVKMIEMETQDFRKKFLTPLSELGEDVESLECALQENLKDLEKKEYYPFLKGILSGYSSLIYDLQYALSYRIFNRADKSVIHLTTSEYESWEKSVECISDKVSWMQDEMKRLL